MTRQSKVAAKPIPLPELPSRQFYTLAEAAAELNRLYGRTDIDENYILQLASMGKIAVQWLFNKNLDNVFIIPNDFRKILFTEFRWYEIQSNLRAISEDRIGTVFIDIGTYMLEKFIFDEVVRSSEIQLKNIFSLISNRTVIDEDSDETINFFFFDLDEFTLGEKLNSRYLYSIEGEKIILDNPPSFMEFFSSTNYVVFNVYEEFFFEKDFKEKYKINFDIKKSELYVLGRDFELIKSGNYRNRSTFSPQDKPTISHKDFSDQHKPQRYSSAREQTLKVLRSMAGIDLDKPYTTVQCLRAHAATVGIALEADDETIINHIYSERKK
jgi:hypothetical protein